MVFFISVHRCAHFYLNLCLSYLFHVPFICNLSTKSEYRGFVVDFLFVVGWGFLGLFVFVVFINLKTN